MKQLAAILLLGIFSFNLFGYRIIASFLENKADQQMELAFDNADYKDAQLISIKQPSNLPYYKNSSTFQRIDGEIEIGGILYKYVKSRIYNDSLELLCIPNSNKMDIRATKADFSKMASDFQTQEKKKSSGSKSFQKVLSEFEAAYTTDASQFAASSTTNHILHNTSFVSAFFNLSPEQPPDVA